uniref:Uncharacterized protein n=1 Tax=Opuntia streptacantha TaxID=393608 RepID=A0A7C9D7D4_OPUST
MGSKERSGSAEAGLGRTDTVAGRTTRPRFLRRVAAEGRKCSVWRVVEGRAEEGRRRGMEAEETAAEVVGATMGRNCRRFRKRPMTEGGGGGRGGEGGERVV